MDGRLSRAFAARARGEQRRVLLEVGGAEPSGTAEDFLRVRLDRDPGPGFSWANIDRVDGEHAYGTISPRTGSGRRTLAEIAPLSYTDSTVPQQKRKP